MNMYDLITKKKRGEALSRDEIAYWIGGYVAGTIPDYQVSALLMAIYFRGMTAAETTSLTEIMAASGDHIDLSAIPGHKIDKHSTGGVGDKTTLIVSPIVAACGCSAPKMSGRGLGHTGGTVDKLESIPGFRTNLPQEEFISVVKDCGLSLIAQAGTLARADKLLYALRDVTATVDSIPLIASSIMSKKLASGADAVLLDVKVGRGAERARTFLRRRSSRIWSSRLAAPSATASKSLRRSVCCAAQAPMICARSRSHSQQACCSSRDWARSTPAVCAPKRRSEAARHSRHSSA